MIITAIKKQLTSDSTRLINELLKENFDCPRLSDNEKLVAGLFQIAYSPVKISYGLLLMAYGVLITPIPGVITKIKTEGEFYDEGTTAHLEGASLGLRVPKTPWHFKREQTKTFILGPIKRTSEGDSQDQRIEDLTLEGYHLDITPKTFHPSMPPTLTIVNGEFTDKATVTGLRLFSTGLDRALVGLCDPLLGLKKAISNPFRRTKYVPF